MSSWLAGLRSVEPSRRAGGRGAGLATIPSVISPRRLVVMALTALVLAPAAMAAPGRVRVETLALREGTVPAVEVGLSGAVEPVVRRLANPPRVYVDVHDARLAPSVARSLAGAGPVTQVRLGQFDAQTVRVVVELATAVPVDVETAGTTLRLVVRASAQTHARSAPATIAAIVASARPAVVPPAATAARVADPRPAPSAPVAPARAPTSVPAPPADVPRLTVVRLDVPLDGATTRSTPVRPAALPAALEERIARRAAAEDFPGVVALYAADPRAIRRDADTATRVAVVDALREMGLAYSARKLLGPATSGEAPALRVARAELALAHGDADRAAGLVAGLEDVAVDPVLVPKLRRVRVRLALARDDLEGAATGIGTRVIPELRAELAQHAIVAGRRATREHACPRAVVAFRQALDADGGRTARAAAGAGLVRAALVCGDGEATMSGLGVLAESPHPLLRRAAAVIASTQTEEPRHAAAPVRRGG
jgi:hypothetical protein